MTSERQLRRQRRQRRQTRQRRRQRRQRRQRRRREIEREAARERRQMRRIRRQIRREREAARERRQMRRERESAMERRGRWCPRCEHESIPLIPSMANQELCDPCLWKVQREIARQVHLAPIDNIMSSRCSSSINLPWCSGPSWSEYSFCECLPDDPRRRAEYYIRT